MGVQFDESAGLGIEIGTVCIGMDRHHTIGNSRRESSGAFNRSWTVLAAGYVAEPKV